MTSTRIPASIDTESAAELAKIRGRILDVRTPAEFESVHIPGSYNVPLNLLSEHREELKESIDGPIILVCATGTRARQADYSLRLAGFESVTVMEGGITAWQSEGREVIRGRQTWSLERQVRGVAGALVLAGTLGGTLLWEPLKLLALFVGGGLLFSAVTDICGLAALLAKLPYNRGPGCDINEIVRQLQASENRH